MKLCKYLKVHNQNYQHIDDVDPYTIDHCLECYTMLDILDEDNKFICDQCNQRIGEWHIDHVIYALKPVHAHMHTHTRVRVPTHT